MRTASSLDELIGMRIYITDTPGSGGSIRAEPEDFQVREVLIDGSILPDQRPPPRPGQWTWGIIRKRGIDTFTMVDRLSRRLKVPLSRISYAGLKDAKAITVQAVSILGVRPQDLLGLRDEDFEVLDAFTMDEPCTSKSIYGNRFDIVIRGGNEDIEETLEEIRERGLPNFFGYQRFGTRRPNTHIIGKKIIEEKFEEAIAEIAGSPRQEEPEVAREARELFDSGRLREAMDLYPAGYRAERLVTSYLLSHSGDFVGALRQLPLELLRLYVESYQSYLFNKSLSERIGRGLPINSAIEGDNVLLLDEKGLPTIHRMVVTGAVKDRINSLIARGKVAVAGALIGYKTNEATLREWEKDILREEGVGPRSFRLKAIPEASASGGWRVLDASPRIDSIEFKPLRLSFLLRRGMYATILIRELIKPDNPINCGC